MQCRMQASECTHTRHASCHEFLDTTSTEFKKLNMSLTRGSLADIKDDMCATEF